MSCIRGAIVIALLATFAACDDGAPPSSGTVATGPGSSTPDPGPGGTTVPADDTPTSAAERDEAFYADCRQQFAVVLETFGEAELGETLDRMAEWQQSGCEAECGPLPSPSNPRCRES